jgi:hypothetical protein
MRSIGSSSSSKKEKRKKLPVMPMTERSTAMITTNQKAKAAPGRWRAATDSAVALFF